MLTHRPTATRSTATRVAITLATVGAVAGLAPSAAACPYCSLSQDTDTLIFIAGFLIIPYVVVMGIWWWIKRVIASEQQG